MESVVGILAMDGLWFLVLAVALAGIVRGFSGFGTALVWLPMACTLISPVWAIIALAFMDVLGPVPQLPRAVREGHTRDVFRLTATLILTMPLGMLALFAMSEATFRWLIGALVLAMLAALVFGWRYRGHVGPREVYGMGAVSGLMGGAAGLPGPPIVLFYMARPLPPQVVRATMMLFLVLTDVVMIALFGLQGRLEATPVLLGLMLIPPYLVAVTVGAALFRPERERLYRGVAYGIIGASAVMGLPVWG